MILLEEAVIFSEQEFYQQQYRDDRKWGRALVLVIFFHVLVFAAAKYLPEMMHRKPLLEDVMTIDLVSMPEPAPAPVQPPEPRIRQPLPAPKPEAAPPKPEKAVAVDVPPPMPAPEPVPVPEAKPISIRPLKRKIRKAKDIRLEEEKRREQLALDRIRERVRKKRAEEKALARKRAAEKRARQRALARAKAEERRAREVARNARAEIAEVLREQQSLHTARPATGGTGGARSVNSALEKQYYMDLASRVQRLWVLPEIKKWAPSLETIIEFTVLADGRLANVTVAKKSGDSFFDRFARETVKKAAPMPPIPPALKKNHLDLGFRLRPAGVQN
ncbi:MAG TPA: energy transducer TonB [Desulfobulbus sp.]|nr:energy transducer TonB [Desulfobulbus sp.]